jgi:hypothetical protein
MDVVATLGNGAGMQCWFRTTERFWFLQQVVQGIAATGRNSGVLSWRAR